MILHDFNKLLNDPKLNDLEVNSNYQKLHALLVKKFSYNIAFPIISELIGPNNIWLEDWDDEFNIFMKTIFVLLPCKNKIDLNIKEEKKCFRCTITRSFHDSHKHRSNANIPYHNEITLLENIKYFILSAIGLGINPSWEAGEFEPLIDVDEDKYYSEFRKETQESLKRDKEELLTMMKKNAQDIGSFYLELLDKMESPSLIKIVKDGIFNPEESFQKSELYLFQLEELDMKYYYCLNCLKKSESKKHIIFCEECEAI